MSIDQRPLWCQNLKEFLFTRIYVYQIWNKEKSLFLQSATIIDGFQCCFFNHSFYNRPKKLFVVTSGLLVETEQWIHTL